MSSSQHPKLEPGRVYRTRDFSPWAKNSHDSRSWSRKVFSSGSETAFSSTRGRASSGRFPAEDEILDLFLDVSPDVVTGTESWNDLGLGTTAAFASSLVYNQKRSGRFTLAGNVFDLRRVSFPEHPPKEWYVVDLFENADRAGASRTDLARALGSASVDGPSTPGVSEGWQRVREQEHGLSSSGRSRQQAAFIHDDPEFPALLEIVGGRLGLDVSLVEKDYWVTSHAVVSKGAQSGGLVQGRTSCRRASASFTASPRTSI
jgi:hypothetical protein